MELTRLTLLPIKTIRGNMWLARTRLDADNDSMIFRTRVATLEGDCLPDGTLLVWHGDSGMRMQGVDEDGRPLSYVNAKEFRKIMLKKDETSPWNVGVLQFMKALPPDTPVVLWWH